MKRYIICLIAWFCLVVCVCAQNYEVSPAVVIECSGVTSLAFSPDGKLLASGSIDKTICLWETTTGKKVKQLLGHNNYVTSVAFSPDGKLLASGSEDRTVILWEVVTGNIVDQWRGHEGSVNSVAFCPNGKLLASGSYDERVCLWDVATGDIEYNLPGYNGSINSVAFSSDGRTLACGNDNGTICQWEVATGKKINQWKGHGGPIKSVAFSPDGEFLASGSTDKTVCLWTVTTGEKVKQWQWHDNDINSVAFSPNGEFLASGSDDKTTCLWEVATGEKIKQWHVGGYGISSVSFSPDSKTLASGSLWKITALPPRRGLPPNLFASLGFQDENGDSILEATEKATIFLTISNTGKGPANNLVVTVKDDKPDTALHINSVELRKLDASDTTQVKLNLEGGIGLKSADHRLLISVREHFGYDMDPAYLLLSTLAYRPPQFHLAGVEIIDSGEGTGAIVEDGRLQKGEQVKVRVVVQNIGQGLAGKAAHAIRSGDDNIYVDPCAGSLGDMVPGEVKEFWMTVSPNKRVECTGKLPLYLSLTESVGRANVSNLQLPLELDQKPPQPIIVQVKPDLDKVQRQIAHFDLPSPKFTARLNELPDVDLEVNIPEGKNHNPDALAVILGVENYSRISPATCASHDAAVFKEYAVKVLGVLDDGNHIYCKTDNEITKGEMLKLFSGSDSWLAKRAEVNSDIYIFYSGHGSPGIEDQEPYLMPYDHDPNYFVQSSINLNELYAELDKLPAQSVTVFLDACFSGTGRENQMLLADSRPPYLRVKDPVLASEKLTVFTATSSNQISSSYPEKKHGLFTFFLLKGLSGEADLNGDDKITVEEMENFLTANVSKTAGLLDREQTPRVSTRDKTRILVKY